MWWVLLLAFIVDVCFLFDPNRVVDERENPLLLHAGSPEPPSQQLPPPLLLPLFRLRLRPPRAVATLHSPLLCGRTAIRVPLLLPPQVRSAEPVAAPRGPRSPPLLPLRLPSRHGRALRVQ